MVGSARWEFNKPPSPGDLIELRDVLLPILQRAATGKVAVLRRWLTQEAPAAETEIRATYTHLFDGTVTPALVYADSSDNAQDNDTGTGGRTVSVLANDEDDNPGEISIALNGTTPVTSVTKVKRVNDLKVTSWGSGGRAVGTVQVVNVGDTEVYAQAAATTNHTLNARTYIPTGWKAIVAKARARYTQVASATGHIATDGVNGRFVFDKGDGDLGIDKNLESRFNLNAYGSWQDITPPMRVIDGAAGAYISLTHQATHTDTVTHWATYDITIIMWKEA